MPAASIRTMEADIDTFLVVANTAAYEGQIQGTTVHSFAYSVSGSVRLEYVSYRGPADSAKCLPERKQNK